MKKEILIGGLLILMLAVSIVNNRCLERLTGTVASLAEEAAAYARRGQWAQAERAAEDAVRLWNRSDTYTHLVLRHPELEDATDALYGLLERIYARDPGAAVGAAMAAAARMESLSSIEQIRLGSVF